jgi:hypothetical protein
MGVKKEAGKLTFGQPELVRFALLMKLDSGHVVLHVALAHVAPHLRMEIHFEVKPGLLMNEMCVSATILTMVSFLHLLDAACVVWKLRSAIGRQKRGISTLFSSAPFEQTFDSVAFFYAVDVTKTFGVGALGRQWALYA